MSFIHPAQIRKDALEQMKAIFERTSDPLTTIREVWQAGEVGLLDLVRITAHYFELERREAARLVAKATFDVPREWSGTTEGERRQIK